MVVSSLHAGSRKIAALALIQVNLTEIIKPSRLGENRYERILVVVFYLCFFLFFSSGRLSGGDPNDQLKAAMLLTATGSPGTDAELDASAYNWVRSPGGRNYEAHDIGSIVLMLPSAFAGSLMRNASVEAWVEHPPFYIKTGAALTYAVAAALGAYALFLLFGMFHPARTAFLLSLAFVTTTPFWAFSRCAFDVLGGAIGVCMLLYTSTRVLLLERIATRDIVLSFASLAVVSSFRYSLMPFMGLSFLCVLWLRRKSLSWKCIGAGAAVFVCLMFPTFVYNFIRMGSPLRPATVAAKYLNGMNALTGNPLSGLLGMLLSPNWGMVFYSPEFLLLAALPFMRKQLPWSELRMAVIWGLGALLYLVPVSCSVNWHGVVGWGSRYMVPVLPIFFLLLTFVMSLLWSHRKRLICGFIGISFLLNVPPALVNWHEATLNYVTVPWPQQIRYHWAYAPRQQIALWNGLIGGLQGKPLPASPVWYADPVLNSIVAFPDLWTFRLMRLSKAGLLAGASLTAALLATMMAAAIRIFRNDTSDASRKRFAQGVSAEMS